MRKARETCAAFMAAWLFFGPALSSARAAVEAPDLGLLEQEQKIKVQAEEKIQRDVLEPILGRGKAMVFVDVQVEIVAISSATSQVQAGAREAYKSNEGPGGIGAETKYLLPGVPMQKGAGQQQPSARPEQAQQQQAQQQQQATSNRYSVRTLIRNFKVTVIHDASIPKARLELVRERIADAMTKFDLRPENILFKPTLFSEAPPWQEFRQPGVLVPLIFAALLFLLLMFLFGPVTLFMGRVARSMKEDKGPTVDVDSRFENAPGQGQGAGSGGAGAVEGSFEHLSKALEDEEAEKMKKIEPFKYINEENLKRLAYLVRREEPWVIAVVLTYLQPEYARAVVGGLPRELQAKVALELATIRQVSREQVLAIDAEIREKVDFVLGGIDHLCNMLEDADEVSRQNILEYLQNERPALYDKVRQAIVMFEDAANFPDREMQTIVRELKTETMARALQQCSPEMMHKFLANMSTGAASLLKEAMEYEKALTEFQIQDERKKIMDVIKRLEKDGRIQIREAKGAQSLEGLEEEVSAGEARKSKWGSKPQTVQPGLQTMAYPMGMGYPMMGGPMGFPPGMPMGTVPLAQAAPYPAPAEPAPAAAAAGLMKAVPLEASGPRQQAAPRSDEAEARTYLDAGVSAYEEGRYDEALPYLEYAASAAPSLWQAEQYLGLALYAMDRNDEAMAHFDKLLALNPSPEVREWVEQLRTAA